MNRYLDHDLAQQVAEAKSSSKIDLFGEGGSEAPQAPQPSNRAVKPRRARPPKPTGGYALEDIKPAQKGAVERIPGTPNKLAGDQIKLYNTPPDPATVIRPDTPGHPIDISMEPGISVTQWPPSPVTFTDPDTGEETKGFKVQFSTGDEFLVPAGQEIKINQPNDPQKFMIGGEEHVYSLSTEGKPDEDVITLRYATVFCTRGL